MLNRQMTPSRRMGHIVIFTIVISLVVTVIFFFYRLEMEKSATANKAASLAEFISEMHSLDEHRDFDRRNKRAIQAILISEDLDCVQVYFKHLKVGHEWPNGCELRVSDRPEYYFFKGGVGEMEISVVISRINLISRFLPEVAILSSCLLVVILFGSFYFRAQQWKVIYNSNRVVEDIANRLEAVVNNIVDGIITIDEKGIVESVNPAAQFIFGYAEAELIGRNISLLMPEPYKSAHDSYIEKYLLTGNENIINKRRELKGVRKGGQELIIELAVSELPLEGRRLFSGIVRDITDQKKADKELLNSRHQLLEAQRRMVDAINSVPDAFVLYDSEDRLVICNSRYREFYDLSAKEIKPGAKFEDILKFGIQNGQYQDAIGREEEWLTERIDNHRNPSGPSIQQLKNGRWLRVEERRTQEGGIAGFRTDITDLKLNEVALKKEKHRAEIANEAKDRFLAMISHEIRTPLNGVRGILGLLQDTELNENQQTFVETGLNSSENLLSVINDILDFSKISADKLVLEEGIVSAAGLVDGVIKVIEHRAQEKDLKVNTFIGEDVPPYFYGDPGRLNQILLNLIGNAVKYTEKGSIKISITRRNSNALIFEVEDTGLGIEKEKQNDIFREFTTIDPTFSRKFGGTGLGLAICKRLVDLMGGEIHFESEFSVGSRFHFNISVVEAAKPERGQPVMTESIICQPLSILLVDDNSSNLMIAEAILKKAKHKVLTASDGFEAIEAAGSFAPDMILMDISMPEMNGMEATREIRNLSEYCRTIPIIAMTAQAMHGDRERFISTGMNDYLAKPFDRHQLLQIIAKWSGAKSELPHDIAEDDMQEAASGEILDPEILVQLARDTSPVTVPKLARLFIDDLQKRKERLHVAQLQQDLHVVEIEAHTIGSSSANFGLMKLHNLSRQVEEACRNSAKRQALSLAAEMSPLIAESLLRLEAHIADGEETRHVR